MKRKSVSKAKPKAPVARKPKGPKKPHGRPSDYTEIAAAEICARLAGGESLLTICNDDHMPAYRTVFQWLQAHDGFAQNYAHARETQGHADADRITQVAADCAAGRIKPDVARVVVDSLKWTAARRLPKVYGDRQAIDHSGGITLEQLVTESAKPKTDKPEEGPKG